MNLSLFDKETILDLTVNIVPLVIIAFFAILYVVLVPWGTENLLVTGIAHGILLFTFLSLVVVTYIAAVKIESGETGPGE